MKNSELLLFENVKRALHSLLTITRFLILLLILSSVNTYAGNSNSFEHTLPLKKKEKNSKKRIPANEDLLNVIKSTLNPVLKEGVDYVLTNVSVTSIGAGYVVKSSASFLGMYNAMFKAEMVNSSTLSKISLELPAGSKFSIAQMTRFAGKDLSAFLPSELHSAIEIRTFFMDFAANKPTNVGITINCGNWNIGASILQSKANLLLLGTTANFTFQNFTNNAPGIEANLGGTVSLGNANIQLNGILSDKKENWVFNGSVGEIGVGSLLTSLGLAKLAGTPDAIWNLGLRKGTINVAPYSKKLNLLAETNMGALELGIDSGKPGSTEPKYLLVLAPLQNFSFASILAELAFLDNLKLNNTLIALSTESQVSNLSLFKRIGQDPTLDQGITLLCKYDLAAVSPELSKMIGETSLLLRTNFANGAAGIKLIGALKGNIPFDKNNNVVLKEVLFGLVPDVTSFTVSLGGTMEVKAEKEILKFNTNISANLSNLELKVDGLMTGLWVNPFKISEGISVKDLGLSFGATFKTTPIPLPTIGLTGNLIGGSPSTPIFSGGLTAAIDPTNPKNCMLDARLTKLKLADLLAACVPSIEIPKDLKKTVSSLILDSCRLTIVPSPTTITLFEKNYEPGFLVQGKSVVSDYSTSLFLEVSTKKGVDGKAEIDPINFPPYFSFTGASGEAKPSLALAIKPDVLKSKIEFSGSAKIFEAISSAKMNISDKGIDMDISQKIFDLFQAQLAVKSPSASNGQSYTVKATMANDFFNFVNLLASNEIDKATKENQNTIKNAQVTLTAKQQDVAKINEDIVKQKANVAKEREADCEKYNEAKKDLKKAKNKVADLDDDIDSYNAKIKKLKKQMKDDVTKVPENSIKISDYAIRVGALETTRATADGVLKGYKAVLLGLEGICNETPIDLDPRVSTLIVARDLALLSLEAAKKTVEGFEVVSTGSLKATKWIVKNGSQNVVNIISASFSGSVSSIDNGVVTMKIEGSYAGEPLKTSFSFHFKDAQKTVEVFAQSLLK